eukprot:CAMPEP_0172172054 /NCGR_PEP_ID=MMETSP1050-20130122/12233_1 /TAXON_ID=233186 /ORGANISM="Cryptomonas curvata, Strain CCAP979/52" /LENGTH=181 /DNA_ID=CAMNT_0012843551 /DNA_START=355 /DNA_END=898 /DNA_ORIENTATION=-
MSDSEDPAAAAEERSFVFARRAANESSPAVLRTMVSHLAAVALYLVKVGLSTEPSARGIALSPCPLHVGASVRTLPTSGDARMGAPGRGARAALCRAGIAALHLRAAAVPAACGPCGSPRSDENDGLPLEAGRDQAGLSSGDEAAPPAPDRRGVDYRGRSGRADPRRGRPEAGNGAGAIRS